MQVPERMLRMIASVGEESPGLDRKLELLRMIRGLGPDAEKRADQFLVQEISGCRTALGEAREAQKELGGLLDKLSSTPWFPATFLDAVETPIGLRALVQHGPRRLVEFGADLDPESFEPGDEVYLSAEMNVIMAKAEVKLPPVGEIAAFERPLEDGRILVRSRDEEILVRPGADLDVDGLREGDHVVWSRPSDLAMGRLETSARRDPLLPETPDIGPECIGGQKFNLDALLDRLRAPLLSPEKAELYGVSTSNRILLVGPPGCGKTLLVRVSSTLMGRVSGKECRLSVVAPGEWRRPYVGEGEMRLRACFRALREAAGETGLAILFLDEAESLSRSRGTSTDVYGDKLLASLLTELDGFAALPNVAVILATNRKDLLDPALVSRVGTELRIERPRLAEAREIFEVHLPASVPFASNGHPATEMREEVIEQALSRLFDPNADNQVCVIRFRDGRDRAVAARELMSGRLISQISEDARRRAFRRDDRGGGAGVTPEDMDVAVTHAIERLRSTLSRHNCRQYLDLPQDVDVLSVEPVARRVTRPRRYLREVEA